ERVSAVASDSEPQRAQANPHTEAGLWSELRFRLRRPLGILTGTIDKLLITPAANGDGIDAEIIDFKTNRFRPAVASAGSSSRRTIANAASVANEVTTAASQPVQGFFNFDSPAEPQNDQSVGGA